MKCEWKDILVNGSLDVEYRKTRKRFYPCDNFNPVITLDKEWPICSGCNVILIKPVELQESRGNP